MPTGFGPHRDLSLRIWTLGGQQFALRIHSSKTVNNLRRAVRRLTKKQGQFDLVHSKKGATFGTDNDFGSAECRAVRQKTLRQLHIRSGNDIQILAVPPQIDSDGEELPWLLSDSSDDEIPCRVADSSDDDVDGVPIERRQGEPVGALGSDWRETRRQNRSLFYAASTDFTITPDKWEAGPVRVWFQDKATEDTIVAASLSDLFREEGYEYALKSIDCVSAEHNDIMDEVSFLNNQIQHSIGPRQTAKTQITDIRYARMCKVAANAEKIKRRRYHRQLAERTGRKSDMNCTKLDLMHIARAMHKSMVKHLVAQKKNTVTWCFLVFGYKQLIK